MEGGSTMLHLEKVIKLENMLHVFHSQKMTKTCPRMGI